MSVRGERGQVLRLVLELAPSRMWKRTERLESHPPALVPPSPREGSVHEERRNRVGGGGVEHEGTIWLMQDLRPLDRLREWCRRALEQELAGQQGAVELADRQAALGQRPRLRRNAPAPNAYRG